MKNSCLLGDVCSCLTILAISFTNVHAALIDNGIFTTDTETGLDWLDLTETANLSYDYVSTQLGQGGIFQGWSLASIAQVETLFNAAGGVGPYDGSFQPNPFNDGPAQLLLNLWGALTPDFRSQFYTSDIDPRFTNMQKIGEIEFLTSTPAVGSLKLWVGSSETSSNYPYMGMALVRDSASVVPIPAALWLFSSGLLGLAGMARRKKAS